jgi:dTDP-D-glucose 4,6-dehydratase
MDRSQSIILVTGGAGFISANFALQWMHERTIV